MELEKFQTCETAKKMLGTVSNGFYEDSYFAKWFFQVMGMEMEDARKRYEELPLQIFPETATWGLRYQEQKYGLQTDRNLPLEERRKKVIAKRDFRAPISPARLEKLIRDRVKLEVLVTENTQPYTFTVCLTGEVSMFYQIEEVILLIKKVKPSHLSFFLCTEKIWEASLYVGMAMVESEILTIRQVL